MNPIIFLPFRTQADTPSTAASAASAAPAPKLPPKVALELAVEHRWVDTAAALEAATEAWCWAVAGWRWTRAFA